MGGYVKARPKVRLFNNEAKTVELPDSSEDPHIIYDKEADKWRVLVCTTRGGFAAAVYEADKWDGPYKMIAGPVDVNSTGCLLQRIGAQYYALFGSSDHKFYVYSYPDLRQLGDLDMHRPPWSESENSRCWPSVIPLPDGYPAPYIALSMDRANFTNQIGWTYGALYLYHGHPKDGERATYEYSETEVEN